MQIRYSVVILVVLLSAVFNVDAHSSRCKDDSQCCAGTRRCLLCIQGKGPFCSTAFCLGGKCHAVEPCSLDLSGTCNADSDCVTNLLCAFCIGKRGPACTQARCIGGQCTQIAPCSIEF